MGNCLIRKLLSALAALFLSSILLFVLIRLAPGDPVKIMLGGVGEIPITNTQAYEERAAQLREELGLDHSLPRQYLHWLGRVVQLDFGTSILSGRPVRQEIGQRLSATLLLAGAALGVQLVLGLTLGIAAAQRARGAADEVIRGLCVLVASMPGFVFGLIGLSLFGVRWHLFSTGTSAGLDRLWLPALTLGLLGMPPLTRIVRANMLNEYGKVYFLAGLARGLPRRVLAANAFRNILPPVVTVLALTLASLLAGAVVIENIFSWPGIGSYAMESVINHDYPVVQAYCALMVVLVVSIHLAVDLSYLLFRGGREGPGRRDLS